MNLETFRSLLTPAGDEALAAAALLQPREADFLSHLQALSRRFPAELAKAALGTSILRHEALSKFPFAEKLYLTREAFEQASAYEVSAYRSGRYRGLQQIIDLGCSVGADTLGLAAQGPVVGVDLDPLRLEMAQANLRACGAAHPAGFVQADLNLPLPLRSPASNGSTHTALFFDPARRSEGRRVYSVQAYSPPLFVILSWLPRFPALGVKISPGVDLAELAEYDAEVEFISLRGELKEAVLWFGPLKTAPRRATLLPGPHTLVSAGEPARPISPPLRYLYEPDPSILRAGLVAALGTRLEASQLDPDIAYLTADQAVPTPFARCWEITGWLPFNLKRLRARLREQGIGRVVVKKRGSPLEPEALIQSLRLSGEKEALIFLTHWNGKPIAILSETP